MKRTTKKTMQICDEFYTVISSENVQPLGAFKILSECYGKPSLWKQQIYDACCLRTFKIEKFLNAKAFCEFGVLSYNTCMFSFGANFYSLKGDLIATYYETKTRRELRVKEGVIA